MQADVPGYSGTAESPSPAVVHQAVGDGARVVANEVDAVNVALDKANGDLATAFGAARAAAQAGACGQTVVSASPIPHIR